MSLGSGLESAFSSTDEPKKEEGIFSWPGFFDIPCNLREQGIDFRDFHTAKNPLITTYGVYWFIVMLTLASTLALLVFLGQSYGAVEGCLHQAVDIERRCYLEYYLPDRRDKYITYINQKDDEAKKTKQKELFNHK